MKKLLYFIPAIVFFASCGNGPTGGVDLPLNNAIDSASYAYGQSVSQSLNQIKEDMGEENALNVALFNNAVRDGVDGNSKFTEDEMRNILSAFGQKAQAAAQKKKQEDDMKNIALGADYLAKNKEKEGVQVTASGLQYKVITEGTGAKPTPEDKVTVHYTGKLIDGTVFDSSVKRGQPATFGVTGVIKGWIEGLQLMKEGAKYEFCIPSDLAYGPRGNQGIPGNSVLNFEVELLKIEK